MSDESEPSEPAGGTSPLSQRASRRLVVVMIVIAVLGAAGASYFLVSTARNADQQQAAPPDFVQDERPSPRSQGRTTNDDSTLLLT